MLPSSWITVLWKQKVFLKESQFSHQIRIYSQIYQTDWQRFRNPIQLDVVSSLCSVIYLHTYPNTAEPKHAHIMASYTLSSSIYLARILELHIIYRLASQMVMGILSLYLPRKKKSIFVPTYNSSACCYMIPAPAVLTIATSKPTSPQNNGRSPKLETHILSSVFCGGYLNNNSTSKSSLVQLSSVKKRKKTRTNP